VSGWTICSTWTQRDQQRRSSTQKRRSAPDSRGRLRFSLRTATCWRKARFSATRSARDRKADSRAERRTRRRRSIGARCLLQTEAARVDRSDLCSAICLIWLPIWFWRGTGAGAARQLGRSRRGSGWPHPAARRANRKLPSVLVRRQRLRVEIRDAGCSCPAASSAWSTAGPHQDWLRARIGGVRPRGWHRAQGRRRGRGTACPTREQVVLPMRRFLGVHDGGPGVPCRDFGSRSRSATPHSGRLRCRSDRMNR